MNRNNLFTIGALLIFVALLFAFSIGIISPTGFLGMASPAKEKQEDLSNAAANAGNAEQAAVNAGLSFTTLQKTELEAKPAAQIAIPECPQEADTEITIENKGAFDAEKVFVKFGKEVKVIACKNCKVELLKAGQSVSAKARLCRETREMNQITIGSANSNAVSLQLGQEKQQAD
ncbi:MAG: hypothetical protein NTW59_05325 [Candidatus Diapherotrites archaeon]|nr:hypothetical protein [Candidatus Diapherotrites archaeon]